MALSKDWAINEHGIKEVIYEDSYIRIDSFEGKKGDINFNVNIYAKKDEEVIKEVDGVAIEGETEIITRLVKIDSIPEQFITVDVDQPVLKQLYNYLKTLPKFANAEDC